MTTPEKPLLLLWVPEPGPYRQAIERAGLDRRVDTVAVPMAQEPAPELLARAEAMLAFRAGAGLLLTCARGTHRVQMPENILGALFHLTKPYAGITIDQRERRWRRRVSETLTGKTLGILGLGAIGQELARKAEALELRVIGTRRNPAPMPHIERVLGPEGADDVLAESDFVLLLLPVTAETRGFMNAARLKQMKPTAYLLNFGRGELVADADLIEAVKAGTIAGAVLDVFTTEPLPAEHPFWVTEGITVLPHIGGLHPERDHIVAGLFVDNLERFLAGQPLRETVDRARGY